MFVGLVNPQTLLEYAVVIIVLIIATIIVRYPLDTERRQFSELLEGLSS